MPPPSRPNSINKYLSDHLFELDVVVGKSLKVLGTIFVFSVLDWN